MKRFRFAIAAVSVFLLALTAGCTSKSTPVQGAKIKVVESEKGVRAIQMHLELPKKNAGKK